MGTKLKVVLCAITILAMIIIGRSYWQHHNSETIKSNDTTFETKNDKDITEVEISLNTTDKIQETTELDEIKINADNNTVEIETDRGVDTEFDEKPTTESSLDTTNDIIEDTDIVEDTADIVEDTADIVEDTIETTSVTEKPTFYLSDNERHIVECIVMGESGYESYEGQVLVAQCLLNACLKDSLQPSEVRTKYQYRGWMDNPTNSVKQAVSAVFDDGYKLTDEFILYFYSPKYSKGKWHETQRFVIEIGGHRFFAEWDK